MRNDQIETIAHRVLSRLSAQCVEVEASGRHVHLSRAAVEALFGQGYALTKKTELSQPGQFACLERVAVRGPKRTLENVVVLGPERAQTQVEISATDALALGVNAPVRMSGQLKGTPGARLIGPRGEFDIGEGVMVAKRHIHITPPDAARLALADNEDVDVTVFGGRGTTFHNVTVRVSPFFATCMHIDYDEANACGHAKGMAGLIQKTRRRAGEPS
ncbi:MAG: phosphate propanoyltransferase [Oscillospiraceae bacterium]|jgi:propanediol utilization protein|nr:phosphate propanoyltransferase [Oscillospiraceae bacterium]